MQFTSLFIAALMGVVSAAQGYKELDMGRQIKANSKAARSLLAKAMKTGERRLEDEFDEAVVASHSVVFESCHNVTTWVTGDGNNGNGGAKSIALVKFSLCPSAYCTDGCSSEAKGEYLVDLETFVDSYLEAQLDALEYKCEMMREQCGCDGDEDDCLYYCIKNYDDGFNWTANCFEEEGKDKEARYGECDRLEIENEDGRRQLDQAEVEYFMGPMCATGGAGIVLALYSDEDCQYAIENGASIYTSLAGQAHPNFQTSLVGTDCVSCMEPKEEDEDKNDDDEVDEDEVIRMCEEIYNGAAKCETYMSGLTYPDTSGCNFISSLSTSARFRRALAATGSVVGSGSSSLVFGGMAVLSVAAALVLVKKRAMANEN